MRSSSVLIQTSLPVPTPAIQRFFRRHPRLRGLLRPPYYAARRGAAAVRLAALEAKARIHPAPVFVLGLQKSGTTAIAALLAERTGLSCTLDLFRETDRPILPQVHAGTLPFETFLHRNRLDFSRALIKEPNLTPFYPQLARRFPESKFVFIVRDPRDAIRSIFNRLGLPGDLDVFPPDDLHRFPEVIPVWRYVLDGRWLGLDGDHVLDLLAERWNLYADLYQRHRTGMILVRYEDFEADKAAVIDNLAEQLRLPALHPIEDLLDHPFQPPGDRSVSWTAFYGDRALDRIERRCAARMRRLGYAPSGS